MDDCAQSRHSRRVPGLHQSELDRHAAQQPDSKNVVETLRSQCGDRPSSRGKSDNVEPFSKCSMNNWPMLRVQAAAVMDDATRPIALAPGTNAMRLEEVTAPKPVGKTPIANPMMIERARSRSNGTS